MPCTIGRRPRPVNRNPSNQQAVNRQLGEQSENALTGMLDQSVEWAIDSIPIVSGILIALTEGRLVLIGRPNLDESLERGTRRLGKSAAFSTLGTTLVALDAGILSVPTTTAARVAGLDGPIASFQGNTYK